MELFSSDFFLKLECSSIPPVLLRDNAGSLTVKAKVGAGDNDTVSYHITTNLILFSFMSIKKASNFSLICG
jgi:hypothetical protein